VLTHDSPCHVMPSHATPRNATHATPRRYLPSILFGLADGVIISTVPLLSRRMGSSDKLVGATVAASLIGKLLADVPAGQIHERLGGGVAMALGLCGVCVSSMLAFMCRSPLLLFLALVLTGCSEAVFSVSRGTVVRTAVPVRHRGRAVALLGGINRFSRSIGPVCGGWFAVA
jgi:MFS family permease